MGLRIGRRQHDGEAVGAMLEEGNFDPTVINGGIVHKYGSNTRMGAGEWMVVEADESDGTLALYHPAGTGSNPSCSGISLTA